MNIWRQRMLRTYSSSTGRAISVEWSREIRIGGSFRKWCRVVVRLTASVDGSFATRERLSIVVEDDGPGISSEDRIRIGQRGVRADEAVPGHGIGLAMVQDTVEMYGGTLTIGESATLGGARFALRLPGR